MTSADSADSAATRVFDVAELLESILLHTLEPDTMSDIKKPDEKLLLIAQRVNTSFRSCILGSPEIQRRLGFKVVNEEQNGYINKFSLWFDYCIHTVSIDGLQSQYYDLDETDIPVLSFGKIDPSRLRKALSTSSASWLDMYPQQYAHQHIILKIETGPNWPNSKKWSHSVTVKARPLRDLFHLAAFFKNVADELETTSGECWGRKVLKEFEWRWFFTKKQKEMLVEKPKFCYQLVSTRSYS